MSAEQQNKPASQPDAAMPPRDLRLLLWTMLLVAGFAYVAGVLCDRPMPLASRSGGYQDILKLLASAPILYGLGARQTLQPIREGWGNWMRWNMLGFALPYFIGLHWLYLQHIPHLNYSLTPRDIANMHPVGMLVFGLGALLILALLAYHVVLARRRKILVWYVAGLMGALGALAAATWLLRDTHSPHIHHYFFFGFFIPFFRFKNPVSIMAQAFCAGVYVSGVSEWGMATLWYPR